MADKRRFAAPQSDLQNALARIGALQLQESTDVLPSERLGDVSAVIREVIVASELPRQITALAPVLVTNVDRVPLERLFAQLADAGLERRLGWVVENTLEAIRRELPGLPAKTAWRRPYNRAQSSCPRSSSSWGRPRIGTGCPTCSTGGSGASARWRKSGPRLRLSRSGGGSSPCSSRRTSARQLRGARGDRR